MRPRAIRFLLFSILLIVPSAVLAHSVTVSGTTTFAALDGSADDHDGTANGVFTVSDGDLVVNGTINCSDDVSGNASACAMAFNVSGNLVVNAGGALYAENRSGNGNGAAITLTVGGNLVLNGTSGSTPGAIVSSAGYGGGQANGGNITATVGGAVTVGQGATVDAGSAKANAGNITVNAGQVVTVNGNVLAGPSRTLSATKLTGVVLTGGSGDQRGGNISIKTTTFAEPGLSVGSNAVIASQGEKNLAGNVALEGCGVSIKGLVATVSTDNASARVVVRSGKNVVVDARDLGVTGATLGRNGMLRADSVSDGADDKKVDVFAKGTIDVLGPLPAASALYAVNANPGAKGNKEAGGNVAIISTESTFTAAGRAIRAGTNGNGLRGGGINVSSKGNANLDGATLQAVGDLTKPKAKSAGGDINIRSYSGSISWQNGEGDVRPTGSGADVATQGTIVLTACGSVNTTGSSFPTNGPPVGAFPTVSTGVCSPAAPSLPSGEPVLQTCNTPPVANDATASTNEDTTVTITLSGSDADGDCLTFSIVSGPSNGVLGPIVPTGCTTATVNYSPNGNYNGGDSFVYQANDGNGGTDNANVTITITAVNDPPTFQAGPTVSSLEDAPAQSYPNWATSISAGPADESGQTVSFTVTNDNPSLFSVQPALSPTGTLTWTSAPNAYGTANITVTAQDNGGTANGGNDTSAPQTSSITITPVNDEPSFTGGGNVTVAEDSGAYSATWATAINPGPNESGQTVTFNVTNTNNSLFSAQPAISSSGVLTFTPAGNANGSATVTVVAQDNGGTANGGDDTSAPQTFTITVTAVNDPPSFTGGGNVTVLEDSGAYSAPWASSISSGPPDEAGQTVSFNVSNDNNALFSTQPAISPSGVLTFTPALNAYGSANVTVTLTDNGGGADTSAPQTFTITVTPVNDEPSFTPGGNVTVNEDSGAYSATWATGISAGPNESGQTLTFVVSNDNNALFSAQPAISSSGVLTFTPAANAFGTATVSVYLMDNGGTANGGDDTSPTQTFTITVNAVNDAPSFTSGGNVTVNEDSGAYSAAWATSVSAGPANESGQTLTFFVSNNNNSLFSVQPSISPSGVLTFTVAPDQFGSATVSVYLKDDGGIANGGVDTSPTQTFTINVTSVNDPPSFTPGGNVTVNEDSGPYSAVWATAISTGPANEGQSPSFSTSNDNNALFSVQPSISPAGVLTFTPAPNASGTANVTVTLSDGIDSTAPVVFVITVVDFNDTPIAVGESFETIGNTMLEVGATQTQTGAVVFVTGNLLANDTDPDSGPSPLTTSLSSATAGATVVVNSNGTFTYVPPAGHLGATDSFQYSVSDGAATALATVTITLKNRVWYVKNDAAAGGSGRSHDPFDTLVEAETASVANDTIYVFYGNGTTTGQNAGFTTKSGQRLLGAGVALTVPVSVNGGPNPTVLVSAGTQPLIDNTAGHGVTINNVTNVEVAGLNIAGSSNGVGIFGATASTYVHDNTVRSAVANGIGSTVSGTATLKFENNNVTSSGNAIHVIGGAAPSTVAANNNTVKSLTGNGINLEGSLLTVVGFSGNTVDGDTAGTGIRAVLLTFDGVPGGGFSTISGGNTTVGSSINPVGAAGVVLANVSGDLSFTSLVSASGAGAALQASSPAAYTGSAGLRISTTNATLSAIGGAGLDATQVTFNAVMGAVSSTNSTTNGVSIVNCAGGLSIASGSITNPTVRGVDINGGSINMSYGGSITTTTQNAVRITGNSGGASLTGPINANGVNAGISVTSNTGAYTFDGGLTIATATGTAFSAVSGGSIAVTGTTNTLATTTGTALSVTNTTIMGSHITFRSISSTGAVNAIVLNNTGALGGLKVTGNGALGTGGTILNSTGHAILLTSTTSPSFSWMNIQNSGGSGVEGTGVVNFAFLNGSIDNSGTAGGAGDSNLAFNTSSGSLTENNLSGAVTITNNSLTNSRYHAIDILNYSGTISSATISGNTITSSTLSTSSLGNAITMNFDGSAANSASMTAATIANNVITNFPSGAGIRIDGGNSSAAGPSNNLGTPGSGTDIVSITGNTIRGASAVLRMGTQAINVTVSGKGVGNVLVSNNGTVANPITNMNGVALAVSTFGQTTLDATISNNVIVANNVFASTGISTGVDQQFAVTDAPLLNVNILNNSVSATNGSGILAVARNSNGTMRAKIQNNTVGAPTSGVRQGIRVDSGTALGNTSVCLNISGNTSAGSGGTTGIGIRKQGTNPAVNVFGVDGMIATSTPGVEAYINSLNPAGGGTLLLSATSGFTNCSLP